MKTRKIHVLLVEDNPADAKLASKLLARSAAIDPERISVLHDGEEALRCLRGEGEWGSHPAPDVVLLDLNIPKISGLELLAIIRHDDVLRSLPVIILSSSTAPRDVEETARLWANAYVHKPVDYTQYRELFEALDGFWFSSCFYPEAVR